MDGSQVEPYVNDGRIEEVSAYGEADVVNGYRVLLIHELFVGRLTRQTDAVRENDWRQYLYARTATKAQDAVLTEPSQSRNRGDAIALRCVLVQ